MDSVIVVESGDFTTTVVGDELHGTSCAIDIVYKPPRLTVVTDLCAFEVEPGSISHCVNPFGKAERDAGLVSIYLTTGDGAPGVSFVASQVFSDVFNNMFGCEMSAMDAVRATMGK